MKRKLLHALLLATAVFGFSSCSDDDDGPSNNFTVNGTTKGIQTAIAFYSDNANEDANGNTYYSHDLQFVDVAITTTSGKYSSFDFNINSSTTTLADGTYVVVEDENNTSDKALQIWYGGASIDAVIDGSDGTEYEIISGSATIKKSGDSYTVDLTGKAVKEGEAASTATDVKLHFSGKFQTLD